MVDDEFTVANGSEKSRGSPGRHPPASCSWWTGPCDSTHPCTRCF